MPQLDKPLRLSNERVILFVIALILMGFERFLPRIPLYPWLKLGLVHIVTLYWVVKFGLKEALLFTIMRLWLGVFFFGFNLMALLVGGFGGLFATSIMWFMWRFGKRVFGLLGIAMIGALVHNFVQLFLLRVLFVEAVFVSLQIPAMIVAALLTGALTGAGAWLLLRQGIGSETVELDAPALSISRNEKLISVLLLGWAIVLFVLHEWLYMGVSWVVLLGWMIILWKRVRLYETLRRHWLFLLVLFISALIGNGGFVQVEQAFDASLFLVVKLLFWLHLSHLLRHYHSDVLMLRSVEKLFGKGEPVIQSGLAMILLFPFVIDAVGELLGRLKWQIVTSPISSLEEVVGAAEELVSKAMISDA